MNQESLVLGPPYDCRLLWVTQRESRWPANGGDSFCAEYQHKGVNAERAPKRP